LSESIQAKIDPSYNNGTTNQLDSASTRQQISFLKLLQTATPNQSEFDPSKAKTLTTPPRGIREPNAKITGFKGFIIINIIPPQAFTIAATLPNQSELPHKNHLLSESNPWYLKLRSPPIRQHLPRMIEGNSNLLL